MNDVLFFNSAIKIKRVEYDFWSVIDSCLCVILK